MKELRHTITLGVPSNGDDNHTDGNVLKLRKLLATRCRGTYSQEIVEFTLALRTEGNVQEFDFEGCERIGRAL